jgi:hypothetical protein
MWCFPRVGLALVALIPIAAEPAGEVLRLNPFSDSLVLNGPRDRSLLGVLGETSQGVRDCTSEARLAVADEGIVRVLPGNILTPVADGKTTVTVRAGGRKARVVVRVRGCSAPASLGFVRELEPILARAGCNQGACHGALHGKGGFRLSLLGFDPGFDYREIVQAAKGRRVVLGDPDTSLLLLKPTGGLDHGGGRRFATDSSFAAVLSDWIAEGAPPPLASDPIAGRVEIWPAHRVMKVGENQHLVIRAVWSDGRSQDVTHLAKFDSLNEGVADVGKDGIVRAAGPGETHVMVRFQGQAGVMRVTLPYATPTEPPPGGNFIDQKLAAKWSEMGLLPAPPSSDTEFLRRMYLDVLGTLPGAAEVRGFLADRSPDKRRRAIDRVLDRPEYVDFWALKWGDWLRINRAATSYLGMKAYNAWLRQAVADNRPIDALVRDLLTASGSNFAVGPANFYLTARSPEDLGEATAQLFLGVRMQCARCHHHPFEKWRQEDYCGLAAFFARIGTRSGDRSDPSSGRETVIYVRPGGEVTHPRRDQYVPPQVLDGPAVADPIDRRRPLAEWVTAAGNPFFARNFVNRYWAHCMGRGLVEPVDDLRATNPASIPELLDRLADDFVHSGFDAKRLLRTILASRAYQASVRATAANAADTTNAFFTRATRRRLTAEQLADALDAATSTHTEYPGLPAGTKAIQLPDPGVRSDLLDLFGRPARQALCDCERSAQPSVAQALLLLNGEWLEKKIRRPDGRIAKLVARKATAEEIIEDLYLAALSRLPTPAERKRGVRCLADAGSPLEGAADLLWVLLNTREFLFTP